MVVNLLHNKIVADTISEGFKESVNERLVPMLNERFGDAITEIVMYEDYLCDDFVLNDDIYYPLTAVIDGAATTVWVKWNISDKANFKGGVPFAYTGKEPLDFAFADDVPSEFLGKLNGRKIIAPDNSVELKVYVASSDALILKGKYSQSFVDEMARQLTERVERSAGVAGMADSGIELHLVFAPGTYFEHVSENVTYRRLLITQKGCQARDFWVKWTRLDGDEPYTISDTVNADNVLFELGEDVPRKLREKEYRFLCNSNPDKYQYAMGKKTVTEWRDLIKRAIKRGELEKVVSEIKIAEHSAELSDKLHEILDSYADVMPKSEAPVIEEDKSYDDIMLMAKAALGITDDAPAASEPVAEPELSVEEAELSVEEAEPVVESSVEPEVEISLGTEDEGEIEFTLGDDNGAEFELTLDESVEFNTEAEPESNEETEELEPEADEASEKIDEYTDLFDLSLEEKTDDIAAIDGVEADAAAEEEDELVYSAATADTNKSDVFSEAYSEDVTKLTDVLEKTQDEARELEQLRLESIRSEIETKVRLQYEAEARMRAEAEATQLKLEHQRLLAENARLLREAELAEAKRAKEEQERIATEARMRAAAQQREEEEQKLRDQLEQQMKQEIRERERLAQTARMAIEEQRRLEEERIRERELALSREAERLKREEAERLEAERAREAERIKADMQRRAEEEAERERRSAPARMISKRAEIIFKFGTDSNIIKVIKSIVEKTIVAKNKQTVPIKIKAYLTTNSNINLDVTLPESESALLVDIIKAIGGGGLGVTKVKLEDL